MNKKLCLHLVLGVHEVFHHRYYILYLIITKYVDNLLLVTRNDEWMNWAIGGIEQSFDIGSIVKCRRIFKINSTEVERGDDVLFVEMKRHQSTEIELFKLAPHG